MPDFVDGWAFGNAVGVGLRSIEGWWNVVTVEVLGSSTSGESDVVQTDLKDVRPIRPRLSIHTLGNLGVDLAFFFLDLP